MSKKHIIQIASIEEVHNRVNELASRSSEVHARVGSILKRLWHPDRPLTSRIRSPIFDKLDRDFPHFAAVTEEFRIAALIANQNNVPFSPPKILLAGPPGLGKTAYTYALAQSSKLFYREISMPSVTSSFALSGGDLQWGDGAPGFIAKTLAESPIGNPMILLDEIDKISGGKYDPAGPLYMLLEEKTATRFRDEALGIMLNTSQIIWIATANNIANIPAPISDRFQIIDIAPPTREEMVGVVKSIYAGIRQSQLGMLLHARLPNTTIRALTSYHPREARKRLERGCRHAIRMGRTRVIEKDIIQNQLAPYQSRKIGFY
jgi:ATP-dependent Lon protease